MASAPKFAYVVVMVLLCLVLMQELSECNCGHGCFNAKAAAQEIQNRKVLYEKEVFFDVHGSTNNGYGESLEGWELRKVPSGPDPLHHNGGSPKKPRTTP